MSETPEETLPALYVVHDGHHIVTQYFGPGVYYTGPVLEGDQWFATALSIKDGTPHKTPVEIMDWVLQHQADTILAGRLTMLAPLQEVASRRIIANRDKKIPLDMPYVWEVTLKDGTVGYYLPAAMKEYHDGLKAFVEHDFANPPSHLPAPEDYPTRLHLALKHIETRMLERRGADSGFSYRGFRPHKDGTLHAAWDSWGTQQGMDIVPAVLVTEAEELLAQPE